MMKQLCLMIFCLVSISVISQEQITNEIGTGSEARYIIKEYQGEKYIMTTFPYDSLRVYKLVNGVAKIQYARKFDGIYGLTSYNTVNQFLLLSDIKGSIVYNFADNSIQTIPYDAGLEYTRWSTNLVSGEEIVLRQSSKDFAQSKYLRYNLSTGQSKILSNDYNYIKLGPDKLYGYRSLNDSTYRFYVLDKETLSVLDSTLTPVLYGNYYFFDKEAYLVYFDKVNVKRYNFSNKSHELIRVIGSSYRSFVISQSNDEYVVDVATDFSKRTMIRIDRQSLVSSEFQMTNVYDNPLPDLYYGKYVSVGSELIISDVNTGERFEFNSSSRKESSVILEDRYLIYFLFPYHLMLDLATMESHVLSEMPVKPNARKIEVMADNGIYYLNFENSSGTNQKLYEVNLDTKTGIYSTKIPGTNQGLLTGSKLIKVNEDVILVNKENFYLIKGNQATRLNDNKIHPVRYTEYKVQDNVLHWCEFVNGAYNIYKLQNGATVKIASIPNLVGVPPYGLINLYDYNVTPEAIYFESYGLEDRLFKYNLLTLQFNAISEVDAREYFGFYHKGDFYYCSDGKIVILKANGSTATIKVNLSLNVFNPFRSYKNRLFYTNGEGMFEIIDDKLQTVILIGDNAIGNSSDYKGYLLVNAHPNDYLYDGTTIYSLPFKVNQYYGQSALDDYLVTYEGVGTNTTEAALYNFKTATTIKLPSEVAKLKDISIFKNGDKYVLMGADGFILFNKVVLYETDKNLTFFTHIKEFDVASRGVLSSFTPYINEGFLYTGNTMYLMDTLLTFIPIDGLTGENQSSSVFEQDGYFYFVAIDPSAGRQLFRIQPFSRRSSVDDTFSELKYVLCHPNPVSQRLSFEGDLWETADIFHANGQYASHFPLDQKNSVDVSTLQSGLYVVILTSNVGSKSIAKFLKVD